MTEDFGSGPVHGGKQLLESLGKLPNVERCKDHDVSRVARVRLKWVGGDDPFSAHWEVDEVQGVSTYYTKREVAEAKS